MGDLGSVKRSKMGREFDLFAGREEHSREQDDRNRCENEDSRRENLRRASNDRAKRKKHSLALLVLCTSSLACALSAEEQLQTALPPTRALNQTVPGPKQASENSSSSINFGSRLAGQQEHALNQLNESLAPSARRFDYETTQLLVPHQQLAIRPPNLSLEAWSRLMQLRPALAALANKRRSFDSSPGQESAISIGLVIKPEASLPKANSEARFERAANATGRRVVQRSDRAHAAWPEAGWQMSASSSGLQQVIKLHKNDSSLTRDGLENESAAKSASGERERGLDQAARWRSESGGEQQQRSEAEAAREREARKQFDLGHDRHGWKNVYHKEEYAQHLKYHDLLHDKDWLQRHSALGHQHQAHSGAKFNESLERSLGRSDQEATKWDYARGSQWRLAEQEADEQAADERQQQRDGRKLDKLEPGASSSASSSDHVLRRPVGAFGPAHQQDTSSSDEDESDAELNDDLVLEQMRNRLDELGKAAEQVSSSHARVNMSKQSPPPPPPPPPPQHQRQLLYRDRASTVPPVISDHPRSSHRQPAFRPTSGHLFGNGTLGQESANNDRQRNELRLKLELDLGKSIQVANETSESAQARTLARASESSASDVGHSQQLRNTRPEHLHHQHQHYHQHQAKQRATRYSSRPLVLIQPASSLSERASNSSSWSLRPATSQPIFGKHLGTHRSQADRNGLEQVAGHKAQQHFSDGAQFGAEDLTVETGQLPAPDAFNPAEAAPNEMLTLAAGTSGAQFQHDHSTSSFEPRPGSNVAHDYMILLGSNQVSSSSPDAEEIQTTGGAELGPSARDYEASQLNEQARLAHLVPLDAPGLLDDLAAEPLIARHTQSVGANYRQASELDWRTYDGSFEADEALAGNPKQAQFGQYFQPALEESAQLPLLQEAPEHLLGFRAQHSPEQSFAKSNKSPQQTHQPSSGVANAYNLHSVASPSNSPKAHISLPSLLSYANSVIQNHHQHFHQQASSQQQQQQQLSLAGPSSPALGPLGRLLRLSRVFDAAASGQLNFSNQQVPRASPPAPARPQANQPGLERQQQLADQLTKAMEAVTAEQAKIAAAQMLARGGQKQRQQEVPAESQLFVSNELQPVGISQLDQLMSAELMDTAASAVVATRVALPANHSPLSNKRQANSFERTMNNTANGARNNTKLTANFGLALANSIEDPLAWTESKLSHDIMIKPHFRAVSMPPARSARYRPEDKSGWRLLDTNKLLGTYQHATPTLRTTVNLGAPQLMANGKSERQKERRSIKDGTANIKIDQPKKTASQTASSLSRRFFASLLLG